MSHRDVEKELAKVGRSGLLRLISQLRTELAACKLRFGQLEQAIEQYRKQLQWHEEKSDSGRLDGIYLNGFRCSACGVFNSDEKERRSDCRCCGSKR